MATGYAYFTIETASGGYRAHFYGGNDELVWWTQVYSDKQTAKDAIKFARKKAKKETPVFDRT